VIVVPEETETKDQAALSGTKSSTATGTIKYAVYKDEECKELASSAGEVTVKEGEAPESSGVMLSAGTYYWQAEYNGDSLHEGSAGACGAEIEIAQPQTTLCKAEPEEMEGDLFCPEGEGFSGEIEGKLEPKTEATFESTEGAAGTVFCNEATIGGSFQENGQSPTGGGITAMSFGSGGGACTSTFAGNPKVEVSVESLPFDATVFSYEQAGPPQGKLGIAKAGPPLPTIKLTFPGPPPYTCKFEVTHIGESPVTDLIFGIVVGTLKTKELRLAPGQPAACPKKLTLSETIRFDEAGGGPLGIAK